MAFEYHRTDALIYWRRCYISGKIYYKYFIGKIRFYKYQNMASCINICREKCHTGASHARPLLRTNRKHRFYLFIYLIWKKNEFKSYNLAILSDQKIWSLLILCCLKGDINSRTNFFFPYFIYLSLSFLTKMPKIWFREHEIMLPTHLIFTHSALLIYYF